MDLQKRERLCKAGIDVDGALARFMNNEALLLKFLFRFPADPNFAALEQALAYAGGNRALAARVLGISRTALYQKLERFHLS